MKLHLTILLSAVIIAAGLVLAARQAHDVRPFANDMLPVPKTISRADVIKAVERLDQAKLLTEVANPKSQVTSLHVVDAKAALDGKSIGIFTEATTKEGVKSPLNFSFVQDEFGRWVIYTGAEPVVLPL
ncbi:MAG TPA: hypothetical protein VK961_20570 [Chthoniobacter sp.]|nr:hypothetical protein [Chthoniobacter sp.]